MANKSKHSQSNHSIGHFSIVLTPTDSETLKIQTLTILCIYLTPLICSEALFAAIFTVLAIKFHSSVRKRVCLVLPCWTLAGTISCRPFCTASVIWCMLSIVLCSEVDSIFWYFCFSLVLVFSACMHISCHTL